MFKEIIIYFKKFTNNLPTFYFSFPKKNSLIIFDDLNSKYIKSSLNYKNTYEIKFRNRQFNFFSLLYALIFYYKSNFKIEYINFFLKKSGLNILITSNFNRLIIYQIKKYYPEIKVIIIQNGSFGYDFIHKLKNSFYKNFECDYFFCFSKLEKEKIEKIIKANFILLGSLKNNLIEIKNRRKKKQLVYISAYRSDLLAKPSIKQMYESEKLLLPIVYSFCKRKNIKLKILPGEKESLVQKKYYSDIIKSNKFSIYKRDIEKSYSRVDESLLSVCVDSSLGFEALSRGNKVGFFNFSNYLNKSFTSRKFFKKKGNFYLGFYNKQAIENILEYIYTVNFKTWKNENLNVLNSIPYIKNNSKLNKIMKSIINESKI